ncbi:MULTISPECIES: recombinase family protein [Peptostreptococcaceae]|uniref:Recombinase family protein n=2 Tax=Peptostreptococcaceae TaxID=186804 RepID=A0ABR7K6K8_9FIRM|nr:MULTISPECIES: recombinase family protein [Peptostreptococcaceae]MRN26088.1 recombinase family protein [Romboutsia ilealis]HEK8814281.1 recombinase family protein [Clostridioides difficile]MBC5998346.1 recombinase family protein [Romboutsia faecis]MBC6004565.1 recombinase family protein [Paeniclostridium hominis]CEQ16302.1 site-specific DNA recombinase [[Clostridium] sordellii] [Paeniclostridium sordellii]
MIKRVAIYCRVSTVEQAEEGYSIDEQNLKIREYCEREGHEIYNLYEDRGISGKNITNRPGIKQLLQDATENKFDLVIVWKLNRISRKLLDILNIVELLNKHNIAFRSLTENFETETPSGKLQLNIMGAIGEFERETIAENIKLGMGAKARLGEWCGGVVLGYDIVEIPSDGKKRKSTKLQINEREANTVRRIFDLYSQGYGYKAVVNRVNKEGYKTKRNNEFAVATVKEILKNPVYIGKIRYNVRQDWSKKRRNNINPNPILSDGKHEPIIDMETWNKVQVILKERSKKHNKIYDSEFPLTGILKCPVCGAGMTISRSTSKRKDGTKKVLEYYSCGNWKNKGTAVCKSNSIRVEVADEYVLNKIMTLINNKSILKKVIDNINKNKSSKLQPTIDELDRITNEINKLNTKKSKNIELFEDGILDKNELSIRVKSINDDIDKLKYREQELIQEVQLAEGEPVPFEIIKEIMDRFKEVFLNMSTSQQRKQLIHLLVSQITMNEKREIDSIEIQINDDVITYLMKDELPKLKGDSSFLHLLGTNHINLKISI